MLSKESISATQNPSISYPAHSIIAAGNRIMTMAEGKNLEKDLKRIP